VHHVTTPAFRTYRRLLVAAAFAFAGVLPAAAAVQVPPAQPAVRLVAADGGADDAFGDVVAIDGDTAVVGAFLANPNDNDNQGAAYVYVRTGEGWVQQAKLVAADGAVGHLFGRSVAIDGDTIAVGAAGAANGDVSSSGAVYVFTRTGTSWVQQARLSAADGQLGDELGRAVALSGDTLLAGAHGAAIGDNNAQGAAYVFVRSGATWTQQAKLLAADGASFANFGNAVALDGDTAVIGSDQASAANFWSGSAYVFVRSGGTWTQQAQLAAKDGAALDQFGHAVALSGDTAVVTSEVAAVDGRSNQGAAWVFVRSGATWTQQAKLTGADGAGGDHFGSSVAAAGDRVLVGAAMHGHQIGVDLERGAAYLFARSGASWSEQTLFIADASTSGDHYGSGVALDAVHALVGAPGTAVGGNAGQGAAYVSDLAGASLGFDPADLDFGEVAVGASAVRTVTVANHGTADVVLGTLALSGTGSGAFALSADACSGRTLAPAAQCTFDVGFAPTAVQAYAAGVDLPSSAPDAPHHLPLAGTGVQDPPRISLDPQSITISLAPDAHGGAPLVIGNLGTAQDLLWQITEDAGDAGGVRLPLRAPTPVRTMQTPSAVDRSGLVRRRVADGGFGIAPAPARSAPADTITLTHSSSMEVLDANAVACADNTTGYTRENHFLRTFTLADFGISSSFKVAEVTFGIERISPAASVTVALYTLDGPFVFTNLRLLASKKVPVDEQEGTLVTVPISADVPAGATLVLDVVAPDMAPVGGSYFPGSNQAPETAPSYIASEPCGAANPVTFESIGNGQVHLVMSVTGTTDTPLDCTIPAWLSADPRSGTVAPGGTQTVTLGFDAAGLSTGAHAATLCVASNDPLQPRALLPIELHVGDVIFANGFEAPAAR
jgi:hypothetical protein